MKPTKKEIIEAIAYWNKQLEKLDEVQHDGLHLPMHATRQNQTDKPTIYYIGIDEYSDNFSDYGHYVRPDGSLTSRATNNDFKSAAVTQLPDKLQQMASKVVERHGKDKYIFIFKEEYSYGNQTHKRHARPSVIDIWYPDGQYWRYGLQLDESSSIDAK